MTLEKFLKGFILTGVFGLLITPLIVTNSLFFPFITGKAFFFRIIVELILGAWIILSVISPKYRHRFTWISWTLLAFLVIVTLADIFGVDPERSFWSNFERMEGLITILHLGAYFLVVSSVMKTEKIWKWFWNSSVLVSVAVALHGFFQKIGLADITRAGDRIDATLGNATYFSGYLLVHVFIVLWLLYKHKIGGRKKHTPYLVAFYVLSLALYAYGIFFASTRGTMIGLALGVGVVALLFLFFGKKHKILRKVSVGIIILAVVGGSLFFALKDNLKDSENIAIRRIASISLEESTVQSRFTLWGMALQGFKEKPVLGWGQEGFNRLFEKHFNPSLYRDEPWFDRAHNIVLNWLVVSGVVGLISYLALWAIMLWFLWKKSQSLDFAEKSILTGLLAAYFFHNLFVFDNITSYLFFFSFLAYIYSRTSEPIEKGKEFGKEVIVSVAAVSLIVVISLVYFLNVKGIQAARNTVLGLASANQDPAASLEFYEKGESLSPIGEMEARMHRTISALGVEKLQVSVELKQRYLEAAETGLIKDIREGPEYARLYLFLGILYNEYGLYENAVDVLKRAVELSPTKQQIQIELARSYSGLENYDKAVEITENAYNLYPEYHEIKRGIVIAYLHGGKIEEAESALNSLLAVGKEGGLARAIDTGLLRTVVSLGTEKMVGDLVEKMVEVFPNRPQILVSGSAAYFEIGEKEKSIELLERAIQLEPGFEAEASQIIQEIKEGKDPGQLR